MEELYLGRKIQDLRTQRGLSVRKLSAMAGITPSMLSQIENEQVNPSINTLRAIVGALDMPLYVLFRDDIRPVPVVRADQRRIIGSKQEPDVSYELLTPDTKGTIEFCMMVIAPERYSYRDSVSHAGEEVAFVHSGEHVVLDMDGTKHTLYPGDSVRIPADVPHVWYNPTDVTVQVIFAVTPPTF